MSQGEVGHHLAEITSPTNRRRGVVLSKFIVTGFESIRRSLAFRMLNELEPVLTPERSHEAVTGVFSLQNGELFAGVV